MRFFSWDLWQELKGSESAEEGDSITINGVEYLVSKCDAKGVHLAIVLDDDEDNVEDDGEDGDDEDEE